jgi:hypothetical protein
MERRVEPKFRRESLDRVESVKAFVVGWQSTHSGDGPAKPLTQAEIAKHFGWSQPTVSRAMKKAFGGMQRYVQCFCARTPRAGFIRLGEEGARDIDGIVDKDPE